MKYFCVFLFLFSRSFNFSYAQSTQILIARADSFYTKQDWKEAAIAYENALAKGATQSALYLNRLGFSYLNLGKNDLAIKNFQSSLTKNPLPAGAPIIRSRLARAYAANNENDNALLQLDTAISIGYSNIAELDTLKEFNAIRNDAAFKNLVSKATANIFPCMKDPHAREFDFWIGEWNVYPTGSQMLVGHSVIQMGSGGCFILENWTATGVPETSGKSMNFVDPKNNKWKQIWVGSGGTVTEYINGVYNDSIMEFESTQKTPQGEAKVRFRFFNQGTNQVRQFQEFTNDNGYTWNVSYDLTYIRKKE